MTSFFTKTRLLFLCFMICLASLLAAAYLQYVEGLEPCPLCLMQRWVIILIAVWLSIALLHRAHWRVYGAGLAVFALLGAGIAGRQVWLQHLPVNEQPSCGPGLEFLLENFPLAEALSYVFSGSGECAIVEWTFLGQSLATWSLFTFLGLLAVGLFVLKKER